MNDDASTFELPEYIHSRLQPQILIDFPESDEEYQILKENLPFAEDRILQYVTDFLQQAHAADERYSVRDGINIARFAIKLKSLATGREHEQLALETARDRNAGRGGAALCPAKPARPLPDDSGQPRSAAASPTSRWSRPAGIRHRGAPGASCASARRWSPSNCPSTLEEPYLRAIRRLPQISVIFYADDATQRQDDDQAVYVPVEPADPFVEAIRSAQEIGAQIVFADPDSSERPHLPDTYPDSYALRHIGSRASMSKPIACIRRSARTRSSGSPMASPGSCRAPIRWRACWWWCR